MQCTMQSGKNIAPITQHARTFFKNIFRKRLQGASARKVVENSFGKYEVIEPWTVSNRRTVPQYIPKPSYSASSIPRAPPTKPEIKDQNQVQCMRDSCYLARRILNQIGGYVKPGVTTDQLDDIAHELIVNNGAYPSPLNYHGFPKSICTSVNNVACHGIPDNRPLVDGDCLNVDVTVYLNGYHGDCSKMFEVGETDGEAKRLIQVTDICLRKAIEMCKPNEKFCNIGNVIEETANKHGYNIVPAFAGHGIGNYFHGPPDILHYANSYDGRMQPGMTFTIEPVLSQGANEVTILDDGWTAVTADEARIVECF